MYQSETGSAGIANDRRAPRMAFISFINYNIPVAVLWGTMSVLLGPVEAKLHVGRQLSTLAIPAVALSLAIFAPIVGALASRYSLRLLMVLGAIWGVAGFVLLAAIPAYPVYLAGYFLFLGPSQAVGLIASGYLVTRWYNVNRGRTLGIVSAPLLVVVMPLVANWAILHLGLSKTYLVLAAISAISVVVNLFVIDWPPGPRVAAADGNAEAAGGMTMAQLIRSPRYWMLGMAFISSALGSIVLSTHLVPMARSWGLTATDGATLLAAQALVGILGTFLVGWLGDLIGGATVLALMTFDGAILWLLLLLHPNFPEAVVLFGLLGLNGAGALPVFGLAMSQAFGKESYGRATGIINLLNLPFGLFGVPAVAFVFVHTGSYADAILGIAIFLGLTSIGAFVSRQR